MRSRLLTTLRATTFVPPTTARTHNETSKHTDPDPACEGDRSVQRLIALIVTVGLLPIKAERRHYGKVVEREQARIVTV